MDFPALTHPTDITRLSLVLHREFIEGQSVETCESLNRLAIQVHSCFGFLQTVENPEEQSSLLMTMMSTALGLLQAIAIVENKLEDPAGAMEISMEWCDILIEHYHLNTLAIPMPGPGAWLN